MKLKYVLLILLCFGLKINAQVDTNKINTAIEENKNRNRIDSVAKILNYKGGDKIKVLAFFKVTEDGEITDITTRGPHPFFEAEALKIIKAIPKLDPPTLKGKPASPIFSLPITFVVETDKHRKRRLKREKRKLKKKTQ